MIIRKAFKYRIYPNKEQEILLAINFGCARFVYNYFLNARKEYYEAHKDEKKKGLTCYETINMLVELKKQEKYLWLQDANAQILQQSLLNLQNAYDKFFDNNCNYPRFKNKKSKQSIKYPQGFRVLQRKIFIPKIGDIKAKIHRPLVGTQKNMTISKTKSGKYFASIQCEIEIDEVKKECVNAVGIDIGVKSSIVTSDGIIIEAPRFLAKSEKKLKRLQRQLSRKENGSNNKEKARILLAKQHEKVSNQRSDFIHKTTRWLVDNYDFIGIEDLNTSGMLKNHCLAKHISDASFGEIRRQLEYKGLWYGTKIQTVGRFYPSSKTCSSCGHILKELKLSNRSWKCPECGNKHDRDINAAINIKNEATRAGIVRSNACGESVRLTCKQFSLKQEAIGW